MLRSHDTRQSRKRGRTEDDSNEEPPSKRRKTTAKSDQKDEEESTDDSGSGSESGSETSASESGIGSRLRKKRMEGQRKDRYNMTLCVYPYCMCRITAQTTNPIFCQLQIIS